MPARLIRSVALVAALLVAAGAPIARADAGAGAGPAADAAAEAAIKRGVELRRAGKDQDALEEFRKAYAQARSPRALAQIGLAEQALGRWVDAEGDLEEAMRSKSDPWIRKNATVLNGAVEVIRRHLGSLEVIGPAGAELRIDGRVAGTLPLKKPARVPIGNLTVELRQEGFFPGTRPVSITAGDLTRESIDLQPLSVAPPSPRPAPLAASGPEPGATPGGGGDLPGIPATPQRLPDHGIDVPGETTGGRGWQRPLAWTTAAGALLGGAAGVTALVLRDGAVTDANNLMCNVGNGTVAPADPANKGRCLDIANRGERWRVTALVSFSAAGALAIASAILFVTAPSSAPADKTTTTGLVCAPTLASTGVACHFRF